MKKLVFQLATVAAFAGLVTSCSNDDEGKGIELDTNSPIVIKSGIQTKASDATWQSGDEIGVSMYNAAGTEILENFFNYPYSTESNLSIFHPVNEAETLYFPLDGRNILLKAYYPYMADLPEDQIVHWEVEDQSDLPAIDLMTAVHTSGYNKEAAQATLRFHHRLSKLIFLLSTEESTEGVTLADCDLTIQGMRLGNDYNLETDTWGTNPDAIGPIDVPIRDDEEANERVGIVLPRAAGDGVQFEFTTPGGDVYTADMSNALELEGGNQYTFYVSLSQNQIFIVATIEPWIDNPYEYYTAH